MGRRRKTSGLPAKQVKALAMRELGLLKCPECGKVFTKPPRFERHLRGEHPDTLPPPDEVGQAAPNPIGELQSAARQLKQETSKALRSIKGVSKAPKGSATAMAKLVARNLHQRMVAAQTAGASGESEAAEDCDIDDCGDSDTVDTSCGDVDMASDSSDAAAPPPAAAPVARRRRLRVDDSDAPVHA
eukprot:TRINITY_DN16309_c0_g1_i1.p1 TRINITY_DN16309_c0_g1~~TRINITY_DN16309_c0_g1_i1.p1  ORF type:complete len:187 (+),score=34.43 TRINITY_DN16309_c0_g1_i1:93-653(+)